MKKLTACLLALMMLAMPFAAMADYAQDALNAGRRLTSVMEFDVTAEAITGEEMVDQIINDLMDALKITVAQQGDEGSFAIGFEQADGTVKDVLTIAAATADKDAYIASDLLAGTIVISADEVVPVANRLVDLFVLLGFITEDDAAEIKGVLTEMESMIVSELQKAAATADFDIDLEKLDMTALTGILTKMMEKMTVAEVTMQPKNCDPAVQVYTVTMTPEEMNELLVAMLQFLKDNAEVFAPITDSFMEGFNAAGGEQMTFEQMIDAAMTELPKEQIYAGDVTYRVWVGEQGQLCAMDAVAPMDAETTMTMNYTCLTMNDSQAHSFVIAMADVDMTLNLVVAEKTVNATFDIAQGGVNQVSVRCDVTDRSAENLIACDVNVEFTGNMGADADYVFNEETEEWEIVEGEPAYLTIGVNYKQDVALDGVDFTEKDEIVLSIAGMEFMRATGTTVTGDPAESIMAGKVVRPAELSDADFANWFVGIYNNLPNWLMNLVTSLPQSVSSLMMGM